MFLGPLLLIGLIVLVIWYFQQQERERRAGDIHQDTARSRPIEIVHERYARGEISQDEYERMRRELEESR